MSNIIVNTNTNEQSDVNQTELTNMNHNISSQDLNETNQTFIEKIEQKTNSKDLNKFKISISNEEGNNLIEEEKSEKDSISAEKNLDEALKNLGDLEKSKKNIEENLKNFELLKEKINNAEKNLKNFEKSWKIGKLVTGWKESTLAQKILTFLKIAVTVAISTALFVSSGGGLAIALLVAASLIVLLHYFAKDVINIAKEKLMSALYEAYKEATNFEYKVIKDTIKGITQTTEKIKISLDECKNDLWEQKKYIGNLKGQIETLKNSIKKEIKNKDDEIKKQKEKIAEITKELANTIPSSLKNSAQVEKKARENLSCVEEAQKDIEVVQGYCNEIAKDSQEIKKLSYRTTNQIKNFNKKTVNKLKKFAGIDIETEDDGAVFEKSKLSRLLFEEIITKNNTEKLSEKIDYHEDEISKKKLNKFYLDKKFSAEKSEGSNETIKNLIDKISSSNVEPTKFAKLLTEIVNDQNKMNKAIMESSTKISELAGKIEAEHVKKVKEFCTKIADTLATVKMNEQGLLEMQKSYKKELISNFQKIFKENFIKEEDSQKLEALKEKFKDNKSFSKVFNFVYSKKENQDFGENEIICIKEIINKLQHSGTGTQEGSKITNILDILGNIETITKNINDINDKCTKNISKIKDKDIKDIKDEANKINESIERLQNYSKKLNVEIINKSAHIATASAGAIIGGTAVGVLGTTVGLPVTLAIGGAGLLGTALYKVIEHYKSDKN